jgi:hypothetical protein
MGFRNRKNPRRSHIKSDFKSEFFLINSERKPLSDKEME